MDIDMYPNVPLEEFICKNSAQFVIGLSNTRAFELNSAILMSVPKHPLVKHLIERLKSKYDLHKAKVDKHNQAMLLVNQSMGGSQEQLSALTKRYQDFNIIEMSGPGFYTREVFAYLRNGDHD